MLIVTEYESLEQGSEPVRSMSLFDQMGHIFLEGAGLRLLKLVVLRGLNDA